MEEIKNSPQKKSNNFALDPKDIYNNEDNSINKSQLEKINKNDEANY